MAEEVEDRAQRKEDEVSRFSPDKIGSGRPEKSAKHIEQTQQSYKSSGRHRTDRSLEQLLNHRRRLLQNADACRNVCAENNPQQPELHRTEGCVHINIVGGDQCFRFGGGGPVLWLPSFAGTRMVNTPNIMKMKYSVPITKKCFADADVGWAVKVAPSA